MTRLKQVKCPNCRALLRFKPTASEVVAITCTQCGNLFEVQVAPSGPVSTEPIRAMPVAVLPIAAQPVDPNHSNSEPIPVIPVKRLVPAQEVPAQVRPTQARPIKGASSESLCPTPSTSQRPVQSQLSSHFETELGSLSSPRQTSVHTPVASASSGVGSRPRPSVARLQTRNSLMMPLMIVMGLALVIVLGGFAFLASVPSGRNYLKSINPLIQSPERVASKLNSYIQQYVAVIDKAQVDSEYAQASEELRSLEDRISELAFVAAQFDSVDDARHESLMATIEVGNKLQFDSLETSRMLEAGSNSELASSIADVTNAMNAVQDIVMKVLKRPSQPESKTDQVCLDGLLLERKILRCIATAKSSEEVGPMVDALHVLIDRFNAMAEEQKKSGERVGFIPRDYEGLESGGQDVRNWFIAYIEKNFSIPETFLPTVDDLKLVESRFDGALFKSEIDILATTSRQRVEAALKSGVAYRVPDAAETTLSKSSTPSATDFASATPGPSGARASSSSATTADETVDRQAAADQHDRLAAAQRRHEEFLKKQEEAQAEFQQRIEQQRKQFESSIPNPTLPTGPNSLTIKVFGGKDLNAEELSQRIKRKVGSSSSFVVANGDAITLSFNYSGDLADVAKYIDFGKIDLSDSQSRTIYVDAN